MDNRQDQGRDGQSLADHILLRLEVDPFLPQRANIINGPSSLSSSVDGLSSEL